jgi:PTH1 family peptidyl-tRNA hydrolase
VSAPLKLIIGLGNPGPRYAGTRHNAGFWFVDRLAEKYSCSFTSGHKFTGEIARFRSGANEYLMLKPRTSMNESGRSVQAMMSYYGISPEQILVVHDEIDFDPGIIRIKQGGGAAGHNGVRDIISCIGSNAFPRIRIGVGHPGRKDKVIGSVLGKPTRAQRKLIENAIDQGLEVFPLILTGEYHKAMNLLHIDVKG